MTITLNPRTILNELYRQDFCAFSQGAFNVVNPGVAYEDHWYLRGLGHALVQVLQGKIKRLIITAGPRSLKSHFGSVALPAYTLGLNPTIRILCASYSMELGRAFAFDSRAVMESSFFSEAFPKFKPHKDKWSTDDLRTSLGGYRRTASVGSTLTGFGADLIILDDLIKADEAYSDTVRRITQEWFVKVLLTRLNNPKKGAIIVIAQRLHMDDIPGFLLEMGDWHHLSFPAIAWQEQEIEIAPGFAITRPTGHILHEKRLGQKELDAAKKSMRTADFEAQYNQRPTPPEGHTFKLAWFKRYEAPMPLASFEAIIQSWDTAQGTGETNDYSVCTTWGILGHNRYLLDVFRDRLPFNELQKKVVSHREAFKADLVVVEHIGSGYSLYQNLYPSYYEWLDKKNPQMSKPERALAETPKVEEGLVFLPKEASWLGAFEHEVAQFPHGKYDDQVDSFSQFMHAIRFGYRKKQLKHLSMYKG